MSPTARVPASQVHTSQDGFSLIELLVATAIMLVISATVTSALLQMTTSQQTIWNRTAMHSGVRSATELLQQEVGQAGRVALPGSAASLASAVAAGTQQVGVLQTINGISTQTVSGIFVGAKLTIDAGVPAGSDTPETVTVTAVDTATNRITAVFASAHAIHAPVAAFGGFASGIVPTTATNGSTGSVLKLYGDINGDGHMVYVEYTCDTAAGLLYRNAMAYDTVVASKPALGVDKVLLGNIRANPGGTACFSFEQKTVGTDTFVIDVAITLTIETQEVDAITRRKQTETKALLNVAPRNVFNVWELASAGSTERVQPTPPSVTALLH